MPTFLINIRKHYHSFLYWTRLSRLSSLLLAVVLFSATVTAHEASDTASHIGFQISGSLARLVPQSDYVSDLVQSHSCNYQDIRFLWHTRAGDKDLFATRFHYPTFQLGILHADFSDIKLNRPPRDYFSRLGHSIALYGGIQIDFATFRKWSLGCDMQNGVGFFTTHYDFNTNRDNEIIGSTAAIYVGASLYTKFRVAPHWSLMLSGDFRHLSNGHITRPNLGTNTLGASLALAYSLHEQNSSSNDVCVEAYDSVKHEQNQILSCRPQAKHRFYVDLSAGVSLKSILEEFMKDPSAKVHTYASFSAMIAPMVRYHQLHASGLQFDFINAQYVKHIKHYDYLNHHEGQYRYSPFVFGLGVRHEIFYRHVSMHASLGIYLRHRTGHLTATQESPLYQMIGLRYSLPFTNDKVFIGYNVKAHKLSKADCMQFMVGWRL